MGYKPFGQSTGSFEDILDRSVPTLFAGYGLVASLLLLAVVGFLLDRWLGATSWLLIGGIVMPLILGFAGLVRISRRR
jgi:F0F1-type ATP synthase assembly protein I